MGRPLRSRVGLFLVVPLVLTLACGASVTERANTALSTALVATGAARDRFVEYDASRQQAIVEKASTREDAHANLAAYRARREPVLMAFTIAYNAIAAAAALVTLVERGDKSEAELAKAVGDALSAVGRVKSAVEALEGP